MFSSVFDALGQLTSETAKATDIPSVKVEPPTAQRVDPSSPKTLETKVPASADKATKSTAVGQLPVTSTRRLLVPVHSRSKRDAKVLVNALSDIVRAVFDQSAQINKQIQILEKGYNTRGRRNVEAEYPKLDRIANNLAPNLLSCQQKSHKALVDISDSLKKDAQLLSERLRKSQEVRESRKARAGVAETQLAAIRRQIAVSSMDRSNQSRQAHDEAMSALVQKFQIGRQTEDELALQYYNEAQEHELKLRTDRQELLDKLQEEEKLHEQEKLNEQQEADNPVSTPEEQIATAVQQKDDSSANEASEVDTKPDIVEEQAEEKLEDQDRTPVVQNPQLVPAVEDPESGADDELDM